MLRSNAVYFLILSAIAFSGCARSNSGAITATTLDTGIVNGTKAAADSAFAKQVARLEIQEGPLGVDAGKRAICSGTFVSSHIVLTAAHCIKLTDALTIEITVGADDSPSQFKTAVMPHAWTVHSSFLDTYNSPESDLALLWTQDPLPTSSQLTPLSEVMPSFKLPVEAAGFGLTYYKDQVGPQPAADTYVRSVVLPHPLKVGSDRCFRVNIGLKGGLSHGDSGGPLFGIVDGIKKQIGVVSSIKDDVSGGQVVYTSVPGNLEWIESESKKLATAHSVN